MKDDLGPGDSDPVIETVKRRLAVFPFDPEFTDSLGQRIRGYQKRKGLDVTGLIDEPLLISLGVMREDD